MDVSNMNLSTLRRCYFSNSRTVLLPMGQTRNGNRGLLEGEIPQRTETNPIIRIFTRSTTDDQRDGR